MTLKPLADNVVIKLSEAEQTTKSGIVLTSAAKEKPQIVMDKVKTLFPGIDPKSVVLMDDNDDTLGMYMKQTPFCTAHPMIFMEHLDNT